MADGTEYARCLIQLLRECQDDTQVIERLREIYIAVDLDLIGKQDIVKAALIEELTGLCCRSGSISVVIFIVSIIAWLYRNDLEMQYQFHADGGIQFLMALLQMNNLEGEWINATFGDIRCIHEVSLLAFAELSNTSPIMQTELWKFGLVNICIDICDLDISHNRSGHSQCCQNLNSFDPSLKKKAENLVLNRELSGSFKRIRDISQVGLLIPYVAGINTYEVNLYDRTSNMETFVTSDFISAGIAYPKGGKDSLYIDESLYGVTNSDRESDDSGEVFAGTLLVTAIASCNVLMGHVDRFQVSEKMDEIQQIFIRKSVKDVLIPEEGDFAEADDLICFPLSRNAGIEWRRGIVTGETDDSREVFCLDFGDTHWVPLKDVYPLPLELKKIKPQVSLCLMRGIYPLPLGQEAFTHASRVLRNFCHGGLFTKNLLHMNCTNVLVQLCRLPWPAVVKNSVAVLGVLATSFSTKKQLGNSGVIPVLRELVLTHLHDEEMIKLVVGCLNNLFVEGISNRRKAASFNMLAVLVHILQTVRSQSVKDICGRAIKNLVGNQWELLNPVDLRSIQNGVHLGYHGIKMAPTSTLGIKRRRHRQLRSFPVYKSLSLDEIVDVLAIAEDNSHSLSSDDDQILSNEIDPITTFSLQSASNSYLSDKTISDKKYLFQDLLPVFEDEYHELRPETSLKYVSISSLGKSICAMLNTGHGGSIMFGIERNSRVIGLNIGREQRDRFRLGLDELIRRFNPKVKQDRLTVSFNPVVRTAKGRVP